MEHLRWLLLEPFLGRRSIWYFNRNTTFSRMNIIFFSDAGNVTFKRIFSGRGHCFFLPEGQRYVCNIDAYIQKISYFHVFFDKYHLLSFSAKKKISYLPEKRNTIFPDITKNTVFRREFFGKTIFSEHLEKTSCFQIFFWERSSFFLHLKSKIIFREKEISSSLIIQKRSYFSTIFLERPSLQNIWKKKTRFFVQWSLIGNVFVGH